MSYGHIVIYGYGLLFIRNPSGLFLHVVNQLGPSEGPPSLSEERKEKNKLNLKSTSSDSIDIRSLVSCHSTSNQTRSRQCRITTNKSESESKWKKVSVGITHK